MHNSQNSISPVILGVMQNIDALIRKNLFRLMQKLNLNQRQFSIICNIDPVLMNQMLTKRKGLGKDLMMRICTALNIEPVEFYIDEHTIIPATPLERKALFMARAAESARLDYIAEEIVEYGSQRIERMKKGAEEGWR